VYSANIITVQETEVVELVPEGYDPDEDPITYSYSEPLDEEGKWETTYGDEGEYTIVVTASDGDLETTEEVILIVEKKEEPPYIEASSPEGMVSIKEGENIEFVVDASDLNDDELTYKWYLDDELIGEGIEFNYRANFFDEGMHIMKVIVSDSVSEVENEWAVEIEDVDRDRLLDNFYDKEIIETEEVLYDIPDFSAYDLEYSVSEPLGQDAYWKTEYGDDGDHYFTITIKDGDYEKEKEFVVSVLNKDRAPSLARIENVRISEEQRIEIILSASDEDGDEIEYYVENMPEGAKLKGDTFSWVTNYDTVTKENVVAKVLGKFHLLSNDFFIIFVAKSNELEDRQTVKITVTDVNRAPVIGYGDEIIVNEGDTIKIQPNVYDLDGDEFKFSCSGWINECEYTTTFEDEGTYIVKIKASDTFLTTSKDVTIKVNNANRDPYFKWMNNKTVMEESELEFNVESIDSDGDYMDITAISLPDGAKFDEGVFSWIPNIEFTNDEKDVKASFKVSDGESEIVQDVFITVYNKNQVPVIINASPMQEFTTYAGYQVPFSIIAEDPEGHELSYKWKFGLLEEYNATTDHLRTFTIVGLKDVRVIVSDGVDEVEYKWRVAVISKDIEEEVKEEIKIDKKAEEEKVVEKKVVKKEEIKKERIEKKKVEEKIIEPKVKKEKKTLTYKRYTVSHEEEGEVYNKYTIVHNGEVEEVGRQKVIVN